MDVLRRYSHLKVISEPDQGIYDAMNKGIAVATGDWIYFLGADDRLASDQVLHDISQVLTDDHDVVYGDVVSPRFEGRYDGPFDYEKIYKRNICHQAIFFPSKILREHPYSKKYPIKADWASNIVLMSKYRFCYFNLNIAIFNNKDGISANEVDIGFDIEKSSIFRSAFGNAYYFLSLSAPLPTMVYKLFSNRR